MISNRRKGHLKLSQIHGKGVQMLDRDFMTVFRTKKLATFWQSWMRPLIVVVLIIGAFRSAIADWNDVPTGSMKPSIIEGDRIFVNKLAYDLKIPFTRWQIVGWKNPKRGDIVILFSPFDERRLVKRIVGIPGDEIGMIDNQIFVNRQPAQYLPLNQEIVNQVVEDHDSSYVFFQENIENTHHPVMIMPEKSARRSFSTVEIPVGQYFVMGDNRDDSFDSRSFGFVERRRILGKASAVVMSFNPERRYTPRWSRFMKALP
jgi:signal peptidase I